MQACGAVATSGFMSLGRDVEGHGGKGHLGKSTCVVSMQHGLIIFQEKRSTVVLEYSRSSDCYFSVVSRSWKCRAAGKEDTKERLGGREGSL